MQHLGRLALLAGLLAPITTAAAPQYTYGTTATVPDVMRSCDEQPTQLVLNFCSGYIMGVFDALSMSGELCPRPGFSTEQALAVARKYMSDHPDQWDRTPEFLIASAFKSAFPCRLGASAAETTPAGS